ncbi:MAG TPA: class I SAM-dependent methyltransferase [Steroidobacteraceae bacterium]|nr:class I SAM-dependent methyltransferase [Steroidobacteraceae bacterium]
MLLHSASKRLLNGLGYRVIRAREYEDSIKREVKRQQLQALAYDSTLDGSLAPAEYEFLRELVLRANAHSGPLLEIGTLFGRTTSKMALWKEPQKQIYTLDNYGWNPWRLTPQMHYQLTSLVLQYLVDAGHVVQVRADKDEWLSQYQGPPPALVFCDADHSYEATLRDIRHSLQAGARMICGHDYSLEHPGVIQAVNECGGAEACTGTLWLLRQRGPQ